MKRATMQNGGSADFLSRVLNATGYFKGKERIADKVARLVQSWSGRDQRLTLMDGKSIRIDLNDRIQRLMWGGAYEPHVRRTLTALLRPGDTFVDVGAHIGFFSLIASSLVGSSGRVYAFEANPDVFSKLLANATAYPWLTALSQAVWRESGAVSFSDPCHPEETGWGKLTAVRNEGHAVTVQATSLDDWHKSVEFRPIRAIKIDAEGSEEFILRGARRLIESARPFLIVELNDQLLRETGGGSMALVSALREERYRIFSMGLARLEELHGFSNLICPEVLCFPADRFDEAQSVFKNYCTNRR